MMDGEMLWYRIATELGKFPHEVKRNTTMRGILRWKFFFRKQDTKRTADQQYAAQTAYQIHILQVMWGLKQEKSFNDFLLEFDEVSSGKTVVVNAEVDSKVPGKINPEKIEKPPWIIEGRFPGREEWLEWKRLLELENAVSPKQKRKIELSRKIWKAGLMGTQLQKENQS
jgi:hypothetical protein